MSNDIDESQHLDTLDGNGRWVYPSGSETGYVEVVVPSLEGAPNREERLLARDFGRHTISKIESAMTRQGYIKTGPTQSAPQVLIHYAACSRGARLLDNASQGRLDEIAAEFPKQPKQDEYYERTVKPFLGSLTPHRRRP